MLFYKTTTRKSAPRRRGPAKILDIDETGVTVKFQSQSFKVARYCVRKKLEEKDVLDWDERLGLGTRSMWDAPLPTEKEM